jgi:tetratricopeptide (TPR) repeat protein
LGSFLPALLACLLWLGLDVSAKHALARYEQALEAKGEHFDFAAFIPKPVPDTSNFAFTPVVATSYEGILDKNGHAIDPQNRNPTNRLGMAVFDREPPPDWPEKSGNWPIGEKTDLKALQLYYRSLPGKANPFPVAAQPQSAAADVLLALSKYDQSIEELRQAAALPDSRFPLNYDCDPPSGILLPHLAVLKKCSRVLEFRAVAELHNGQSDQALAEVKLTLRLMASVRSEPGIVSQLARADMLNLALQPIWEGIQEHLWSDVQLKELDQDLATLDFLADYESSVRSDEALRIATMRYLRRTRAVGMFFGDGDGMPLASEIELRFAPSSVYYDNELAFVRACQEWILPMVDGQRHSVSLEAVQLAATNIDQMRLHWSMNDVLAAMMLPSFETYAQRCRYAQSSVDMARVACALDRCRLARGQYPESLDVLAPSFIESVPLDIMGGNPLKYHRTDDGEFVLYSVGWNGMDDGGAVYLQADSKTLIDYDNGDWVWSGQVMGGE